MPRIFTIKALKPVHRPYPIPPCRPKSRAGRVWPRRCDKWELLPGSSGEAAAAEAARPRRLRGGGRFQLSSSLPAGQEDASRVQTPSVKKEKSLFFFFLVCGARSVALSPPRLVSELGERCPALPRDGRPSPGCSCLSPPPPPPAPAARPGLLLPVPACAYPPCPCLPSLPALPAPPRRALSGRQPLKPALLIAGRELIYIYWRLHPLAADPFIFNKEEESCPPVGNG